MAAGDPAFDVFASYAAADAAWVEGYLLDALKQAGVHYQIEAGFTPGAPRLLEFEQAVRASGRTLLILSSAYLADDRAGFIDLLAQTYGLETSTWPVLPILLERVKLPTRLAMLTALDASDPADYARVVERVCAELKRPAPAAPPKPACPYPGMVPFREADSARFFGRDEESQSLLQSLRLHPFLTVIGPSGSGKSSLVFAGLVPALQHSGLFGDGHWAVRSLRPGGKPLAALAEALGGDLSDLGHAAAQAIASEPGARRLLLVIDQFEELFTLAGPEALPFQEALGRLHQMPGTYLTLTVRADFYSDLMACPLWPQIRAHRAEIAALAEQGLRAAIVKPAESVGVFVEGALVERLLTDAAGEPGALPMVQETLVLLWERLERRYLPLRAYEAIVMLRPSYGEGPLTALQVAMSRRADATLAALPPAQQALAQRVFLRLIQFGEGRADTRRQQRVADLQALGDDGELLRDTLRALADHRLLTLGGEEAEAVRVDIAHEALIAGWPTLRGWIAERREAEQTRRRIEAKAAEFAERRQSRRGGGLLDAVELSEAERWTRSAAGAELGSSDSLKRLMRASRKRVLLARASWLGIFLLIGAAGVYAWTQKLEAERRLAITALTQGLDLCEKGEISRGLLWLARALELTPVGSRDLERVIRSNLASWGQEAASLEMMVQQPVGVLAAVFSPDGQTILSTNGGHASLWDVASGTESRTFKGGPGGVDAVAISPDGQTVLTGNWNGTVQSWDLATGKELGGWRGDESPVLALAFSGDGKSVLTGTLEGGAAVLWSVASGNTLRRFAPPDRAASVVAFHPSGQWILTAGAGITRLWDMESGLEVRRFEGQQRNILAAAFSPSGDLVLTAGLDGTAWLWETATARPLAVFRHLDAVAAVAFSADGNTCATGSADHTARLWDTRRRPLGARFGRPEEVFFPEELSIGVTAADRSTRGWEIAGSPIGQPLTHLESVRVVAFRPKGQALLTGAADGALRVWSVPRGQTPRTRVPHLPDVESAAFSREGDHFVTSSSEPDAALWATATGERVPLDFLSPGEDTPVAFSPSGQRVVTEGQDNSLAIWDRATREKRPLVISGFTRSHGRDRAIRFLFSPDEKVLFTTGRDAPRGYLWDAATGQNLGNLGNLGNLREPQLPPGGITSAAFSPDGSRLLTGGSSAHGRYDARLWKVPGGEPIAELSGHVRTVVAVAFRPDGRMAATGSADMTAKLWRLEGDHATPVFTLPHRGTVNALAFSADGRAILTGSGDWTARLWDTANGRPLSATLDHRAPVLAVALSPANDLILTGSQDHTARLWDYHTGRPIAAPLRHDGVVTSVGFSPDGASIVTGSENGIAQIWSVPAPVRGPASEHMRQVELATGMALDAGNAVELLSAPAWTERRRVSAPANSAGH